MPLEIPDGYGAVIATTGVIGLAQFIIGAKVMTARGKCFKSDEFLNSPETKAMKDEHKKVRSASARERIHAARGAGSGCFTLACIACHSSRAGLRQRDEQHGVPWCVRVQCAAARVTRALRAHMSPPSARVRAADMGSGRYAAQLPYPLWVELNNAQRAHGNMIESSGPVLACMLVSGLTAPKAAAALGLTYAAGRWMYARGYTSSKGADGRVPGAMMGALSTLGLFGMAIFTGVRASL